MGTYIKLKCGKCGNSLAGNHFVPNFFGIGKPFIQCPKCNTYNKIAHKQNEWNLMDLETKFTVSILFIFMGLVWGLVIWTAAFYIFDMEHRESILIPSLLASLFTGAAFNILKLIKSIRDSSLRMQNVEYRNLLERIL